MTTTSRFDPTRPSVRRLRRGSSVDLVGFRTPVRGHAFAARPPGADDLRPGLAARLVREPDNPADRLAVAVWAHGPAPWRLGYLDRAVAARLAPRLDDGQRFVVELDGWVDAPGSRWRRPLVRIDPAPAAVSPGTGSSARPDRDRELPPPAGLAGRPPGVSRRTVRAGGPPDPPAGAP